ncbi:MAG: S41 family peptidase [Bacteroidales bacterium]|nr:S41 family peptidase [Bacteroidales bacterium]
MKQRLLTLALLTLLCATTYAQNDKGFEISKNLEIFANVYKNLHQNYVDDVDPGKTMKVAIDAMLASMDPYTNYFAESDMEDVKMQVLGQYGGIGSLIHQEGGNIYIAEPYKDLPADKAGLKIGDRILAVNGESTEGRSNADVSAAMRGQAGTDVTLRLERDGKQFDVTITRAEIRLPNLSYSGMVAGNIGYIRLDEFTQNAAKNVRDAFRQLKRDHPDLKGVILDLRGNGGGLMSEAVDIVNIWVKAGEQVVETKGKVASKNIKSRTRMAPEDLDIPLAVLINGSSASASEIVSGSLQDLDRAVIIGDRSFGKGLVQNIVPMPYNSQMKITVSKYFIPSGRCIQAIDYKHRDENGRAVKVPDSLKTAFSTRNGRTVYDGLASNLTWRSSTKPPRCSRWHYTTVSTTSTMPSSSPKSIPPSRPLANLRLPTRYGKTLSTTSPTKPTNTLPIPKTSSPTFAKWQKKKTTWRTSSSRSTSWKRPTKMPKRKTSTAIAKRLASCSKMPSCCTTTTAVAASKVP